MKPHSITHLKTRQINHLSSVTSSHRIRSQHQFRNIWRSLIDWMTRPPEVRVWTTRDRQGLVRWHAYNPATGQQATRLSGAEMIDWIEQSYH